MKRLQLHALLFLLTGCSTPSDRVHIPLEGSQGKTIARFYSGMISGDKYEELFVEDSTGLGLRLSALRIVSPRLSSTLDKIREGGDRLNRDQWNRFLKVVVEQSTPFPETLAELFPTGLPHTMEDSYFRLKVYGAMTTFRREIYVPKQALEDGLLKYWDRGGMLQYPAGTVIAAYHNNSSGATLELTVKKRRSDGFWDFGVYDSSGRSVRHSSSPPTSYSAPVQCVGCHLGTMLYEPEESFMIGREGKTEGEYLVLEDRLRNPKIVELLDEHTRRSDHVLGVYGTIYLTEILNLP
ncbi:MAG: hypothetical protein WEE20_03815, partial [Bacteroidota bacterium]